MDINIDVLTREDVIKIVKQETAHLKENIDEKILTEKQACKFLQVTKPTLLKMRKEGRVKYFKVGNEMRYKQSDLSKTDK